MITYYIHYTPLNDRLRLNLPLLLEAGISPQVVSQYSAHSGYFASTSSQLHDTARLKLVIANQVDIISSHLISNLDQLSPSSSHHHLQLKRSLLASVLNPSLSTIEHSCQHLYCFAENSQSSKTSFILVLEDDAFPAMSGAIDYLEKLLSEHPFDCNYPFFIDLGNGLGLTPSVSPPILTNELQRVENGRTRCSFAYAISTAACRQIDTLARDPNFYPYLPSDWYISLLLTYLQIPTFWALSPLFLQGSENGLVNSNQHHRLTSKRLPHH